MYKIKEEKQHRFHHRRLNTQSFNNSSILSQSEKFSPSKNYLKSKLKTLPNELDDFDNFGCKFEESMTPNSMRKKLTYNKWYIRPCFRMRQRVKKEQVLGQENDEYAYQKLYQQDSVQDGFPFEKIQKKKLQHLQNIPPQSIRLLEKFKKTQQSNHKRVPKIIELYLQKKNKSDVQRHFIIKHRSGQENSYK